ncbi:hypothetical protein L5L78_15975 [Shewanella sp. SM34]|uniref:hypothetical protein n=1 Tax=unclassified Shewanella TaxID=196818 RepID=UPI0021D85B22|nr:MULTISPECIES: hypothetical protein [unclassified Shewanella]MCU8057771.1 hypothetical protein [Shewanella sp. SM35]MCU8066601.1 hypothetical protein [Shewanella sp. SM34]
MSKAKVLTNNKSTKTELAKQFLQRAEALGIKASIKGNWVVWQPVLPVEMLFEVPPISNELFKLVTASEINTNE